MIEPHVILTEHHQRFVGGHQKRVIWENLEFNNKKKKEIKV